MPDYNEEENLENLHSTIETILLYRTIGKGIKEQKFKTKNLAKASKKMVHGQFFNIHLKHLVEACYLSRERSGKSKNAIYVYRVEDSDALEAYRHVISLLLKEPSPTVESELEKIEQI